MSKVQGQDTAKELRGYFLPKGTIPPSEYAGQTLHSKGFYPEVRGQDFLIRENIVELSIKRRRLEVQSSG